MLINKLTQTSVGADLSRTPPIHRPSVGIPLSGLIFETALSRTPPMYRPTLAFPLSQFKTEEDSYE